MTKTTYRATTESGHVVIIHGADALTTYRADVQRGDAEAIHDVSAVRLTRAEHDRLRDLGQCYGPCDR